MVCRGNPGTLFGRGRRVPVEPDHGHPGIAPAAADAAGTNPDAIRAAIAAAGNCGRRRRWILSVS